MTSVICLLTRPWYLPTEKYFLTDSVYLCYFSHKSAFPDIAPPFEDPFTFWEQKVQAKVHIIHY